MPHFYIQRERGFSLIELLTVLAIMAILAAIAVPTYRAIGPNLSLNAAARDMASDLRYAQQLSVTEQNIYSVVFNISQNSYQIKNSASGSVVKNVSLSQQLTIYQITGLSSSTVSFNATGAAQESGTINLTNVNNHHSLIEIKPSGYVKIQNQ